MGEDQRGRGPDLARDGRGRVPGLYLGIAQTPTLEPGDSRRHIDVGGQRPGEENLPLEQQTQRKVERDAQGLATGRLFRLDTWLGRLLDTDGARARPSLSCVSQRLAAMGVLAIPAVALLRARLRFQPREA